VSIKGKLIRVAHIFQSNDSRKGYPSQVFWSI